MLAAAPPRTGMLRSMGAGTRARLAAAGLIVGAAVCGALLGSASEASAPSTTVALHTIPGANLPVLQLLARSAGAKNGYDFVAEKKGGTTGGPLIVDSRGRFVW